MQLEQELVQHKVDHTEAGEMHALKVQHEQELEQRKVDRTEAGEIHAMEVQLEQEQEIEQHKVDHKDAGETECCQPQAAGKELHRQPQQAADRRARRRGLRAAAAASVAAAADGDERQPQSDECRALEEMSEIHVEVILEGKARNRVELMEILIVINACGNGPIVQRERAVALRQIAALS